MLDHSQPLACALNVREEISGTDSVQTSKHSKLSLTNVVLKPRVSRVTSYQLMKNFK